MAFTPNLVIGVVITLVGSLLILDRLGVVAFRLLFDLWPLLLTFFGLSVVVQALRRNSAAEGTSPAQPIIGPGLVLLLVVVSLLGWRVNEQRAAHESAPPSDVTLSLFGVFGEDTRASSSADFQGADMVSVMGATRLDLRQAQLAEGREVVVDVMGVMGGVEIFVPQDWTVDVRTVTIMGGVRDRRQASTREAESTTDGSAAPAAPRLIVKGMVVMGGLEIKS